ncbi:MAG TPA: ISKra4 family transposase [Thermomicrobiales bacterium]|nr:ISKra4 family transposase [Thermomicrobiales bacterium]
MEEAFAVSRCAYRVLEAQMTSAEARGMDHGCLEEHLAACGREFLRVMFQSHLHLRALTEQRAEQVADDEGIGRNRIERRSSRGLSTVFGPVQVARIAYRGDYVHNLYLQDAVLNLPVGKHSHGVKKMAAIWASRGSFHDAAEAVRAHTGATIGKRQVEELAVDAARDIESFYGALVPEPTTCESLLVMSLDGKGIVIRPEALRTETARAAAKKGANTYRTRLASGEKNGRKRMAEIGAVYDAEPVVRAVCDILPNQAEREAGERQQGPKAFNKYLTGSVEHPSADVVADVFAQAGARDPKHARCWVVLVDGAAHQLELIHAEARRRKARIHVIVDFIHVLEYLWKAAWCLHENADPAAEAWVAERGRDLLAGHTQRVIDDLDQAGREAGLDAHQRKGLDDAITYLTGKKDYLHYDKALKNGWPIATGIIEGACRHLVKDRMDITGARWGLDGAEAVLKLRALRSNGDFDQYWRFHTRQEHQRNHLARFKAGLIPPNT